MNSPPRSHDCEHSGSEALLSIPQEQEPVRHQELMKAKDRMKS